MSQLSLRNVEKSFGEVAIIRGIDLDVADGEFVVFVGPSGCGKSTLLRMIAGLEEVTEGEVVIAGQTVNDLPPVKRGIAMVFQSYALYPHMTVFENIAFPLRVERLPNDQVKERVERAARVLQLDARLEQRPGTLSGGQRQRVAIGRAIVREPGIFLFDEPLSNLDAALRAEMRIELMSLHQKLGSTMIYVTHDQVEAMTMADKIVVLNAGVIEQAGTPLELYHRPQNRFVAGFIGSPPMNFIAAHCTNNANGTATVEMPGLGSLTVPRKTEGLTTKPLTVGVRPEHLALGKGDFTLTVTPRIVEHLGIHTIIHAALAGGENLIALFEGDSDVLEGRPVEISFPLSAVFLFDADGMAVY
jgi:multiple sugar transport system ATP-binding protein